MICSFFSVLISIAWVLAEELIDGQLTHHDFAPGEAEWELTFSNPDPHASVRIILDGSQVEGKLIPGAPADDTHPEKTQLDVRVNNREIMLEQAGSNSNSFAWSPTYGPYTLKLTGTTTGSAEVIMYSSTEIHESHTLVDPNPKNLDDTTVEKYDYSSWNNYKWFRGFVCPDSRTKLSVTATGSSAVEMYISDNMGRPMSATDDPNGAYNRLGDGSLVYNAPQGTIVQPGWYGIGLKTTGTDNSKRDWQLTWSTWDRVALQKDTIYTNDVAHYRTCAHTFKLDIDNNWDLKKKVLIAAWPINQELATVMRIRADGSEFYTDSQGLKSGFNWIEYTLDATQTTGQSVYIELATDNVPAWGINNDLDSVHYNMFASQDVSLFNGLIDVRIDKADIIGGNTKTFMSYTWSWSPPITLNEKNIPFFWGFIAAEWLHIKEIGLKIGVNFDKLNRGTDESQYDLVFASQQDSKGRFYAQGKVEKSSDKWPNELPVPIATVWSGNEVEFDKALFFMSPVYEVQVGVSYRISPIKKISTTFWFEPPSDSFSIEIIPVSGSFQANLFCDQQTYIPFYADLATFQHYLEGGEQTIVFGETHGDIDPTKPMYCSIFSVMSESPFTFSIQDRNGLHHLDEGAELVSSMSAGESVPYEIHFAHLPEKRSPFFVQVAAWKGMPSGSLKFCLVWDPEMTTCPDSTYTSFINPSVPTRNLRVELSPDDCTNLYLLLDGSALVSTSPVPISIMNSFFVQTEASVYTHRISFAQSSLHDEFIYVEHSTPLSIHGTIQIANGYPGTYQKLGITMCPDYASVDSGNLREGCVTSYVLPNQEPEGFDVQETRTDRKTASWWITVHPGGWPSSDSEALVAVFISKYMVKSVSHIFPWSITDPNRGAIYFTFNTGEIITNAMAVVHYENAESLTLCLSSLSPAPDESQCNMGLKHITTAGTDSAEFEVEDYNDSDTYYGMLWFDGDAANAPQDKNVVIRYDLIHEAKMNELVEVFMNSTTFQDIRTSGEWLALQQSSLVVRPPRYYSVDVTGYETTPLASVEIYINKNIVGLDDLPDKILQQSGDIVFSLETLGLPTQGEGTLLVRIVPVGKKILEEVSWTVEFKNDLPYYPQFQARPDNEGILTTTLGVPGGVGSAGSVIRIVPEDELEDLIIHSPDGTVDFTFERCTGKPYVFSSFKTATPNGSMGPSAVSVFSLTGDRYVQSFTIALNNYVSPDFNGGIVGKDYAISIAGPDVIKCRPIHRDSSAGTVKIDEWAHRYDGSVIVKVTLNVPVASTQSGCTPSTDGFVYSLYVYPESDFNEADGLPADTSCGHRVGGIPAWLSNTMDVWYHPDPNVSSTVTIETNVNFGAEDGMWRVGAIARLAGTEYEVAYASAQLDLSASWQDINSGVLETFNISPEDPIISITAYFPALSDGLTESTKEKKAVITVAIPQDIPEELKSTGLQFCVSTDSTSCLGDGSGTPVVVPPLDSASEIHGTSETTITIPESRKVYIQIRASKELPAGMSMPVQILTGEYQSLVDSLIPISFKEVEPFGLMRFAHFDLEKSESGSVTITLPALQNAMDSSKIEFMLCKTVPAISFDGPTPSNCKGLQTLYADPGKDESYTEDINEAPSSWWLTMKMSNVPDQYIWKVGYSKQIIITYPHDKDTIFTLNTERSLAFRVDVNTFKEGDVLGMLMGMTRGGGPLSACISKTVEHPRPALGQCDNVVSWSTMGASKVPFEITYGGTQFFMTVTAEDTEREVIQMYLDISITRKYPLDTPNTLSLSMKSDSYFYFDTSDVDKSVGASVSLTLEPPTEREEFWTDPESVLAFCLSETNMFTSCIRSTIKIMDKGVISMDVPVDILSDMLYVTSMPRNPTADEELVEFKMALNTRLETRSVPVDNVAIGKMAEPLSDEETRIFSKVVKSDADIFLLSPCLGTPTFKPSYITATPSSDTSTAPIPAEFGQEVSYVPGSKEPKDVTWFFEVMVRTGTTGGKYDFEIYPGTSNKRPYPVSPELEITETDPSSFTVKFKKCTVPSQTDDSSVMYYLYGMPLSSSSGFSPVPTTACGMLNYGRSLYNANGNNPSFLQGSGSEDYTMKSNGDVDSGMQITVVAQYQDENGELWSFAYRPVTVTLKKQETWWIAIVVVVVVLLIVGAVFAILSYRRYKKRQGEYTLAEDLENQPEDNSLRRGAEPAGQCAIDSEPEGRDPSMNDGLLQS